MLSVKLNDVEATLNLGRRLGKHLEAGSVILLEGDLGAGKTTLVQGIGEGLGILKGIVSPTFILLNEYTEGRLPLYHFDLYRLGDDEVDDIYPEIHWEGIEVTPGVTAIEWAERLPYKPDSYIKIKLYYDSDRQRRGNITLIGLGHERILSLLSSPD